MVLEKVNLYKKRVWIVGHTGLVGSSLIRCLEKDDCEILTANRSDLNLLNQSDVNKWVKFNRPDLVILCAGKVGGIRANLDHPYEFLSENSLLLINVIDASFKYNVEKLVNISSSCIYPREAPNPLNEKMICSGNVEPSNEGYAYSKIIGLKMCEALAKQYNKNFLSVVSTNLYGPNDNFNLRTAHVPAALIRKFHEAKMRNDKFVDIWGSGGAVREFLHVDDFAEACIFILKNYNSVKPINIGSGKGVSIKEFAYEIKKIVGFKGKINFGNNNLDGMPSKVLDTSSLKKLGWKPKLSLKEGLKHYYNWYRKNFDVKNKNNLINLTPIFSKKNHLISEEKASFSTLT